MTDHYKNRSRFKFITDEKTARELITCIEYYADNHENIEYELGLTDTIERLQILKTRMIEVLSR